MKKRFYLTKSGLADLQKERAELLARRAEITEKLQIARDYGDLSENAEYHNARDEQNTVEARIMELQNVLDNVELIRKSRSETIRLGSVVTLKGNDGDKRAFTMVGSVEANPLEGKISDESPLGQELMDCRAGDVVSLSTNGHGKTEYKVIAID